MSDIDDGYEDRKRRIDRLDRRLKAAEGAWLKLAANLAAERDEGITRWRKLYQNLQQHHAEQMEAMRAKLQEPRTEDTALAALKKVHDMMARPGKHGDDVASLLACIEDRYYSMMADHAEDRIEVAQEQREVCTKAIEEVIDRRWPEVGDRPSSPPAIALDLLNRVANARLVTATRGLQVAVVQAPPVDEQAEARFEKLLRRRGDDRAGVVPAGDAAPK